MTLPKYVPPEFDIKETTERETPHEVPSKVKKRNSFGNYIKSKQSIIDVDDTETDPITRRINSHVISRRRFHIPANAT